MNILVTNARYKNTLAIIRSLGKTDNVTAIDTRLYPGTYFSRYCKRLNQKYTDPNVDINAFIQQILGIVKTGIFDVLLPIGADTTIPISLYREVLEPYVKVPVAKYDVLMQAHDKQMCLEIAESVGTPVPKTIIPEDSEDLKKISTDLEYPVVIKIRRGGAAKGLRYATSPKELIKKYDQPAAMSNIITDYKMPMIQEYIPGDIYDVCTLFNEGEHVVSLAQKRVLTFPYNGGAGIANVTVEYPELINMTIRLMEKMNWHGVAEVEYKHDLNGQPRLMEVNSKFWGTLGLSIEAGVNFPRLLCDMAMGKEIDPPEYERGIRMMWIHPALCGHIKQSPDKIKTAEKLLRFWASGAKLDITWSDPIVSLIQLAGMFGGFFD